MQTEATTSELLEIPLDKIDRNPENPRLVFRPRELEELLESIRRYGVQVPITVYRERNRYALIDGERRWRCSLKLNKKTIPALVQDKPDQLTNLLLMFNIHALREQWDLLTIALKLPRVIALLTDRIQRKPNERELSDHTGLSRGVIRRCKLLIDLPENYKSEILEELQRPKKSQRLTEDFFIEMERALTTVERAMPDVLQRQDRDKTRRALINKFKEGVIDNRTDFRMVSKIARAERVEGDRARARSALLKLFEPNSYSIEDAFRESVSEAYTERDLLTRMRSLLDRLGALQPADLDDQLRNSLQELLNQAARLLEGK
jgi:ParB family transcriptional regulator, chromosome partitioning protein